jgi:hypothetical protein
MPGPFTHIYTARRVAEFLKSPEVTDEFIRVSDGKLLDEQQLLPALLAQLGREKCACAMNDWPKFAATGAIGPDLFFWLQDYNLSAIPCDEIMLAMSLLYWADDQGFFDDPFDALLTILAQAVPDAWGKILRFLVKLNDLWQQFLTVWNDTIGTVIAKAGQVIDDLAGGLFSALGDALTQLKNGLLSLAEEELLTEGDIFGWFSLKMRKGYDEQAFMWSDMTHYRRTSVIPAQLIEKARTMLSSEDTLTKEHGEQLLAFALGWVCHVGTDVIAHSFVNEQCGGPFRTHWQRHHLIENHIDGWNYACTGDGTLEKDDFVGWQESYPSIADAALYFAVQIPRYIDTLTEAEKQGDLRQPLPDGTDPASQAERKKLLDTDGALPLWLAETITEVFVAIYADPTEGGDQTLQDSLAEGAVPHPRNLKGQPFQDSVDSSTELIEKWLVILGLDGKITIGLDDLRKIIAPDPPASLPKGVPEGFPFPWEIMTAYRFMLSWFKRAYVSTIDLDRPEPPTVFTPPPSDYTWGPPDMSGVNSSDDPISQTCQALAALLDWVWKSLENAAQLVYDIAKTIASAATYPARDAIYYGVTLPLWEATENIRMVLVHLGYMMPQSQELYPDGNLKRPDEVDETLITLGHTVDSAFQEALASALDPLGNLDKDPTLTNAGVRDVLGAPNPWLPIRVIKGQPIPGLISQATDDDVIEYQRPWGFPDRTNDTKPANTGNRIELPFTVAGPYPTDTMPDHFFQTNGAISNPARKLYQDAGCPNDTDTYTKAFVLHQGTGKFGEGNYPGTNPLGDPVNFSTYLIGQIANNPKFLSSFNLDADRGYGYLCWDWTRDQRSIQKPVDGQNHVFIPPCVWPEGADNNRWKRPCPEPVGPVSNPDIYTPAVELHYPGRKCKESQDKGTGGDEPVNPK